MNTSQIAPLAIGLAAGFILGWVLRGLGGGTTAASFAPPASAPIPGERPDVEALIREGRLIEAIKLHREQTGVGLKEAKDAVDALQRRIMPK